MGQDQPVCGGCRDLLGEGAGRGHKAPKTSSGSQLWGTARGSSGRRTPDVWLVSYACPCGHEGEVTTTGRWAEFLARPSR